MLPTVVQAALWGVLAASGLLIGAVIAVVFDQRLSHRMIAACMGFGGGVLIAVLSVDLVQTAFEQGGSVAAVSGLLLGASVFSTANWRLAQRGARHRNRCGDCVQQTAEVDHKGSGVAIAVGAVLDGIPESLVLGLSLLGGGQISLGLLVGFFLANIPQGLSSASGMTRAGRSSGYILGVWIAISVISGLAAAVGYFSLGSAVPAAPAMILAFAAGGVLAMLAETMIPEAFEDAQPFIGLITAAGFLAAFLIIKSEA